MLSEEELKTFQKDGFLVKRNAIDADWIEALRRGIDANMSEPGQYVERLQHESKGGGTYFGDYLNWQRIPEYKRFIYESNINQLAAQVLGGSTVFYHEHVLVKEPGTFKTTPWHHDQPYYPINGDQVCSIWMPLDPVDSRNGLQLLPGSHKAGMRIPRHFATACNYEPVDEQSLEGFKSVPDVNEKDAVVHDMQPGDVLIFHMRTLHAAPANELARSRRVFVTRWLGHDATFRTRPWEVSPPVDPAWQMQPGERFFDTLEKHHLPIFEA
eukprot:TRINITY_DN7821_c0_g2_i1.p1 TRINITY_DN7821_c0_g2~~TRINITY_DN7821_c0_g2_i1.p1  ORF type:complete len:269 (+),score=43.15 TRINITY_DN7821_c0_g2_i1:116-922(+)